MILHLNVQHAGQVVRLRTTSLRAETAAGPEPRWCQLFPVGVVRHRGDFGPEGISFTREFLGAMVANWEKAGRPHQHVNYDHSEGIAAGWIEGLELRDDGLYALIRWTAKARGHIAADEYRFLSPEFSTDGLDKATGGSQGPTLYGCALLNDPYLEELPRVAASNNPKAAKAAGADKMDKAKLIALLALAADATEADIEKALADRQTKLTEAEAKLADAAGKLELANQGKADVVQLRAALDETAKQLKLSNERITAMENEKKEAAVDGYLADRVKAGVLTPAMVPGVKALALSTGLDAVKAIYDAAPVVVAMGEKGIRGEGAQTDALKLHAEFVAKMDALEKEGVDPSVAFTRITRERPDLAAAAAKINH